MNFIIFIFLIVTGSYDRPEREHREPPKKGNTIYIHGIRINEDLVRSVFTNFGKIIRIRMETEKKWVLFMLLCENVGERAYWVFFLDKI